MRRFLVVATALLLGVAAACGGAPAPPAGGPGDGTGEVTLWFHSVTGLERTALADQVRRFNALGTGVTVRTIALPEGDYGRQLEAADRADRLPDLLDVDGTALAALVAHRRLAPLDGLADPAVAADVLPGVRARGTVGDRLYGLGQTDAGVVLFVNRDLAVAAGVRLPDGPADAWTATEFGGVLRRLAATDTDGKVLDLRLSDGVEPGATGRVTGWWATAFAPVINSAGGALVSGSSTDDLDPPAVVDAVRQLASWRDYVETDDRDLAFRTGTVAVSWASTRAWLPYAKAIGRKLVVVPLPDFGGGTKTTEGTYTWAVAARSPRQRAAATFLDFLLSPAEVAVTAAASGGMPGTRTALKADRTWQPGGTMAVAAAALARTCPDGSAAGPCVAARLPTTPGWNTVRTAVGEALRTALTGGDPGPALAAAATRIDADFAAHGGYPLP